MKIWIDGDASPKAIKKIVFAAAQRTKMEVEIVANHHMVIPPSPFIKLRIVRSGFDVADNYIVENLQAHDLVITADIPLANDVIEKNAVALNPRGKLYTTENIKQTLAMRNVNETLRDSGMITGGPSEINQKDIQKFANNLDRLLAKAQR